jgi:hypothetical protein|uniref:HEN1 double-stranded RNA binding domain-containing protein n=1 Tax=Fagus sylvatica TaxID=28930 RepID=A0A2N9J2J5_FAGSY
MLISKIPSGIYKLSRETVLIAELPLAFTTRTNWRGSFPRDVLLTFSCQHRLSEPVFSTISTPLKALSDSPRSSKKLKVTESAKEKALHAIGGAISTETQGVKFLEPNTMSMLNTMPEQGVHYLN